MRFTSLCILLCSLCYTRVCAQSPIVPSKKDTLKGSITSDRVWWDLHHYALTIQPDFDRKFISGSNEITFKVVTTNKDRFMQIDLQQPMHIDSARYGQQSLEVQQNGDVWFLKFPILKLHSIYRVKIYYSGKPKESFNPPWDGGVSWTLDSLGRPWITTGVQNVGASVWFPCKEHQSDEPNNGTSMSIIVPDTLVGVGNGRLIKKIVHQNKTATYTWEVKNPINHYGLALYIGKYVELKEGYEGELGMLNTDYWVMDYHAEKVHSYLKKEVDRTLRTFEYWFGPYPFYKDSFKMVEAPYPGMEHQSAIAYGNGFKFGRVKTNNLGYWDLKTDRLVVHEIAHEWFGNSITTNDVTDQWIHEGFAGFAEELFIEQQYGKKAAKEFFEARTTGRTKNTETLIRRYGIFESGGSYVYLRGWKLIHMLRKIIDNDAKFRHILRSVCREFHHKNINSIEMERYITKLSGKNLAPVFNQFLRNKGVPVFEFQLSGNEMRYRYSNCVSGFTMPLKTNLTENKWLVPDTKWKRIKLSSPIEFPLTIDSDFYVELKSIVKNEP